MQGVLPSIEACVPALRRYAQALLRNPQEADDLVHDTLARALGRLHTRRDDGEIRPWLFSIMHNLFVSQARRARVRAWAERLYRGDATIPTVEPDQEQGLRWRDVVQGLQSLPIEQRTVVLLVRSRTSPMQKWPACWEFPWAQSCRVWHAGGSDCATCAKARRRVPV